jgi:hypothetical protein
MKNQQRSNRVLLLHTLCALACAAPGFAFAQATTPPTTPPDQQTSTEQGDVPMSDSFGAMTYDQWVAETRRKAWEDTTWTVQLRTYYLDRDKYDDSQSEAWALGGSAGFKTGYFRDRFALGGTVYTSQKLYGPEDKDGTLLLANGQESYTMLGELYGEILVSDDVKVTLGARAFDTPYVSRNDSRMTPNTFIAAAVQGLSGEGTDESPEWRWGAAYFDEIKPRNENQFFSMSEAAGAEEGVDRGVFSAGLNYKRGKWSLGAINYYSADIINIFYTEGKYTIPLANETSWSFALQYSDQQSVGDELLDGTEFDAHQWGGKTELSAGPALLTLAYTSTDGDTNMRAPWSHYPGYTSVQVEDFNRAGEDAWMIRAGFDLSEQHGLSVYGLYVGGSKPDATTAYARGESDFNFQWKPPEGKLQGLMVRLRYAYVQQNAPGDSDLTDLRVMVYYDLPL